jgi:hypothetical protein
VPRQYLDDAHGPDGIRVSIAVERASARLDRAQGRGLPNLLPSSSTVRSWAGRLLAELGWQGAWVVDVESDSGVRTRLKRADRHEAMTLAQQVWREVSERGVAALDDLA